MTSKYTKIYKRAKSKIHFIELCLKEFKIKEGSADRRWYDEVRREKNLENRYELERKRKERKIRVKKEKDGEFKELEIKPKIVEKIKHTDTQMYIPQTDLTQPDAFKLLTVQDMVNRGFKPSREFLRRYGFNDSEIDWLITNKYITIT